MQHRAAPDHRGFLLREEPHRHDLDAVLLGRPDLLADGFELRLQAEHDRHVRAVDVTVEDADASAVFRQRHGKIDRDRRLADAALPAPTAITFLTPGSGGLPCSGAKSDFTNKRRRHGHGRFTPGKARRTSRTRATSASSFRGRRRRHLHGGSKPGPPSTATILVLDNFSVTTSYAEIRVCDGHSSASRTNAGS
jgi:hypothetical protein